MKIHGLMALNRLTALRMTLKPNDALSMTTREASVKNIRGMNGANENLKKKDFGRRTRNDRQTETNATNQDVPG